MKTATRESLGRISFKSSKRFPMSSGRSVDKPVMLPLGFAKLATKPLPITSLPLTMTMGIVAVASLAARISPDPTATMTSTLMRTNSAAMTLLALAICSPDAPVNDDVFAFDVTQVAQTLAEGT